jgi:hypothetical protein
MQNRAVAKIVCYQGKVVGIDGLKPNQIIDLILRIVPGVWEIGTVSTAKLR